MNSQIMDLRGDDMFQSLIRKLSCRIGNHQYLLHNEKLTKIGPGVTGNTTVYRAENTCIYCGHHRSTVIEIENPRNPKTGE